tara:strand:+ start:39 stop:551 length:513 start_codon:yes stop_codon:yes gene_type:complete
MKFLNKFLSILIFLFISICPSYSEKPIAYIDIDFIIKNSNIGKKTLDTINNQNNKNIKTLKQKEKILKDLEIQIANKKNIISKEVFEKEVIIFKEKIAIFKEEQKKIVKNFNNFKKEEIDKIFLKISPIINSYMEKNAIHILFDAKNIFMARNDLNLTDDLLKEINKEIK